VEGVERTRAWMMEGGKMDVAAAGAWLPGACEGGWVCPSMN